MFEGRYTVLAEMRPIYIRHQLASCAASADRATQSPWTVGGIESRMAC